MTKSRDWHRERWASTLPRFFVPRPDAAFTPLREVAGRLPDVLRDAAQAFIGNLERAQTVAAMPFSFTSRLVYRRRFDHLFVSAKIRALKDTGPNEGLSREQVQAAAKWAHEDLRRQEQEEAGLPLPSIASEILTELENQLEDGEFADASRDLLHQTLAATWGALEVLVNEVAIALLNESPQAAARLLRDAPAKRHFGSNLVGLDVLAEHNFDLSGRMGEVLLAERGLSSLEVIRDVFSVIAPGRAELHGPLNSSALWLLWQRRHVVVHRRGVVDKAYIAKTGDETQEVGQPLRIDVRDVDAAFRGVIDAGLAVLSIGAAPALSAAPPSAPD
ncbi:hypothetical protein [Falsiroseomonas sp.]|uniref:hypothetical protein n=1 Tax=Falsiroseomonas sp. TaxID=2870721 RepID=UPI0034A1F37E